MRPPGSFQQLALVATLIARVAVSGSVLESSKGPCVPCDDVPQEPYMSNNGKTCATWSYAHTDKCALDAAWVANRWCARSCFENGNGYDAGGCCPHPSPPPLPPTPPAPPATPPSPPALVPCASHLARDTVSPLQT